MEEHKQEKHDESPCVNLFQPSAMKKPNLSGNLASEKCLNRTMTDLNTLMNGSKRKRDREIIEAIISIAELCVENDHKSCTCDVCDKTFVIQSDLKNHAPEIHSDKSLSLDKELNVDHHVHDGHSEVNIAIHEEDYEDMVEFEEVLWDVLFTENDAKELTKSEKEEVIKLHKYFAHRNGRKLWENLFQPSGRMKGKKKMILEMLEGCEVCRKFKRTPPRPKVGLPKARDVNDVVSLDLKIFKKEEKKKEIGILYLHDEFSKLIKGQVVNDKKPETIIKGIESKWIVGDGVGPGHPSRGFFTDNGGEFLNADVIDFAASLDITVRMTAASSPWMNGSCERNHATVDRILEKILEDDPKIGLQKAVDLACFVKNTEINKTGFSPLQLFCGRSPTFPGLSDCTPSSIELDGNNEYLAVLRRLDNARIEARRIDCDHRMKTALKSKINTSCQRAYNFGDPIYFKLDSSHKWKTGIVLGMDGKVLFVRYGNFIRRVPVDRVVPAEQYQEGLEEEADPDDIKNNERLDDDEFENVEILAIKDKEIELLKQTNTEQENRIAQMSKHLQSGSDEDETIPKGLSSTVTKPVKEKTLKKALLSKLPKIYQKIRFQVAGKSDVLKGKVINKHKPKSINKEVVTVRLDDGSIKEFDFVKDVTEWSYDEDVFENDVSQTYATVLTKSQVAGRSDAKEAVEQELQKFKDFSAFKTVEDRGQHAIKTRWVFTEHEDQSKGYKLKSRLCMRGDTEENIDSIRTDSPTTHKDSLKLALAVAANEEFEIMSADIKSAFLQGKSLEREVFVIPPTEAQQDGKLWLLQKGAYGLLDGSRLFYLQLKEKLEQLGLKQVSGDPALFTFHRDGILKGIVCIHVDDLLLMGKDCFKKLVPEKLFKMFKFSKVEKDKFKYLGCEITKHGNGNITLNQNDYIQKIDNVVCPARRNTCPVKENERKEIRRVVGELLWVSLMTRPDISFEVNQLSSNISTAKVKDLKDAKRLVEKAKDEPVTLTFTKLGPIEKMRIKKYCDASFNNQDEKLRSTEGRVLLLENADSRKVNLFSWKTKKITRICRSVKGAETRSLENGLDDSIHFARMFYEIFTGKVNLKSPKQIPVRAATDNKSLWENLNNTRQCNEKLLQNSIALVKEMVARKEVQTVDWVETSDMLADTLTKRGGNAGWIKSVIKKNEL